MLYDGLTRKAVAALAINTLMGATLAGDNVFSPRDWPTTPDKFPILLVQIPQERKAAHGRGLTKFVTTMTLVVVGRIMGYDPSKVEADADKLAGQVEDTLLSTTAFVSNFQLVDAVETLMVVTSDSRYRIGEVACRLDLELTQVYGPTGVPFTGSQATLTNPAGTTVTLSISAAQTAPSTTLQFNAGTLTGLWAGMAVSGADIQAGSVIASLSNVAGTVTLSAPTTATAPNATPITFSTTLATAKALLA